MEALSEVRTSADLVESVKKRIQRLASRTTLRARELSTSTAKSSTSPTPFRAVGSCKSIHFSCRPCGSEVSTVARVILSKDFYHRTNMLGATSLCTILDELPFKMSTSF